MSARRSHLRPVPPVAPAPPSVPPGPRPVTAGRARWYAAGLGVLLLVALGVAVAVQHGTPEAVPVAEPAAAPRLIARGQVRPVSQARVGTVEGGVVLGLAVDVGDAVLEQQQIARIRGPAGNVEVLTSPLRGTVTSTLAHVGDTLLPGAAVLTVGDLTRLQVESTDVDEYIVGSLHRGQPVTMVVDALGRLELQGVVRSIALEPVTTTAGDDQYPVIIDLASWPAELRPGMTVRITFFD